MWKIYSKLTIKTLGRRYWRRSGAFIIIFKQISLNVLVFPLWTSKSRLDINRKLLKQTDAYFFIFCEFFKNLRKMSGWMQEQLFFDKWNPLILDFIKNSTQIKVQTFF